MDAQPRIVITGEKISDSPPCGGESIEDFPDPERITVKPGRNSEALIVYHPVPEESVNVYVAHIDRFACTLTPPQNCDMGWLFPQLVELFKISGMTDTGKGWNGYKHRLDLDGFGILAWGGERQRGTVHIELNATGCAMFPIGVKWKLGAKHYGQK